MAEGSSDILLKVENLRAFHTSKTGLIRAVNGISFEVKKGESVGIFGESGAGKSSIALSILGVFNKLSRFYSTSSASEESERLWALHDQAKKKKLTPEEMGEDLPGVWGQVLYKGKDLLSLKEKELRKVRGNEITYVPQGLAGSLNPYTEIDLQTAEALWAHDDDDILWEREVARRVLEVLDLVEIGDVDIRKTLKPGEFSLGEDQRILIAMALIMEPSLMIADEPTTAVDVGVQQRILDAIILAKERLGLSILMISNDQGVIAETADQVGVMSAGKLMEFGDVRTILKSPGHPFTRAFVMSNPPMDLIRTIREKGLRIRGIPGNPPDMANPPPACPFNPRCEYAKDICREELPDYREVETGHWVLCHRYEELPEFEL
ncbi:MAG: ABC transporter ATP-binding protein [Candidatus Thorarchaeota archaeon]|jgi:oligopeptide/dipeptide ABC transporter ATP-binding protein